MKLIALLTLLTASFSAQAKLSFEEYVKQYEYPMFMSHNRRSFNMRLKLLEHAPKDAHALIMTFTFEDGYSTRKLAHYVKKAADRGVHVKFLGDSHYGTSIFNLDQFDHPEEEELYHYMASGKNAEVRIFNPMKKASNVIDHFLDEGRVKRVLRDLIYYRFRSDYKQQGNIFQDNRLNHRKLFLVMAPSGSMCMMVGGRNLGDHYLMWMDAEHSIPWKEKYGRDPLHHLGSFMDGDLFICDHHVKPDNIHIFPKAIASFFEIWNNKKIRFGSGGTKTIKTPEDFKFEHIQTKNGKMLDPYHLLNDLENPPAIARLHSKETIPTPNYGSTPILPSDKEGETTEFYVKNASNWNFLTSVWDQREDHVRHKLWEAIQREQEEIHIETGYLMIDRKTEELLLEACRDRKVGVHIIGNSLMSDGFSNLIGFAMAPYFDKLLKECNEAPYTNNQNWKKTNFVQIWVSDVQNNHMIHFKGAFFKKQVEPGKEPYSFFLVGSHNFHERSGYSDAEHAITFETPYNDEPTLIDHRNKYWQSYNAARAIADYERAQEQGKSPEDAIIRSQFIPYQDIGVEISLAVEVWKDVDEEQLSFIQKQVLSWYNEYENCEEEAAEDYGPYVGPIECPRENYKTFTEYARFKAQDFGKILGILPEAYRLLF